MEDPQDPVDHGQPEGDEGVNAPHGDSIGELLPEHKDSFQQSAISYQRSAIGKNQKNLELKADR
jgi:hypothetical protein